MASLRSRVVALAALVICYAPRLGAQCADGSPPPCAQAARPAARLPVGPPDPNRIALLPFRVTTTDSLLGEGFAELLSSEFTGEGAPRAVDMATTINAWRRAGGGLRTPLPRSKAMEVARGVGAGLVADGSIVGLGRSITVTATLLSSTDGAPRGEPVRVTANADSLDAALRQMATGLIGTLGGQRAAGGGVRYTDSPEAMRHYLQGLSSWRRGRIVQAATAFDRAIASDSNFAQAWFRRYFVAVWTGGSAPFVRQAWDRRTRLSLQERTVLEGMLGAAYPAVRPIEQRVADREGAAARLPDSPDAQYLIGDYYFHFGAAVDPVNHLTRARDYLMRAAALDSATTTLRHLIEVGIRLRDTAVLRAVVPDYLRSEDAGRVLGAWLAAVASGNPSVASALRRSEIPPEDFEAFWFVGAVPMANVPAAAIDEIFARWAATSLPNRVDEVLLVQGHALAARGRPAAGQQVWARLTARSARSRDLVTLRLSLAGGGTGLDARASAKRLRAVIADTVVNEDACVLALWRFRDGDSAGLDLGRFVQPRASVQCALAVSAATTARDASQPVLTRLNTVDSTLRNRVGTLNGLNGFESLLLAEAWEANRQPARALAAIRYRQAGLGPSEVAATFPYEGRLALAAGDTTGAARAWRMWLEIMADAEPVYAAKRDSVRSVLARLTRGPTP